MSWYPTHRPNFRPLFTEEEDAKLQYRQNREFRTFVDDWRDFANDAYPEITLLVLYRKWKAGYVDFLMISAGF